MAPTQASGPYAESDFTLLQEHAEQTPVTFFSLTPVLHLSCPLAKLRIPKQLYASQPVFAALQSRDDADDAVIEGVDVWVTSKFLGLYQASSSNGVEIDYPSIIMHGQQGEKIMLELNATPDDAAEIDYDETLQLLIEPGDFKTYGKPEEQLNGHGHSAAAALYKAIEACQELNPSPIEGDEDEADMPSFPGSGGWITSDNAGDFLDENGQFKPPTEWSLGPGAGHTRAAGDDEEEGDTKWQRTD